MCLPLFHINFKYKIHKKNEWILLNKKSFIYNSPIKMDNSAAVKWLFQIQQPRIFRRRFMLLFFIFQPKNSSTLAPIIAKINAQIDQLNTAWG